MKKLLSVAPSKVLILCGIGLLTTLGSFWHLQMNQHQLDRMGVLNQGVGICFNRISQTFTALMIKDVHSSYLNRGFMGLSDECLNETIKGINPFKQNVGKGYETLNKLISEVHWFHETVSRSHGPMITGKNQNTSTNSVTEKFSKMEDLKVSLVDEIESTMGRIREIQVNDEILMGIGLLIFVLSLSTFALQEFNRIQLQKEIESQALSLLKAGQSSTGAMVDRLIEKALMTQNLPVTAQIFKDYHEEVLERLSLKTFTSKVIKEDKISVPTFSKEVETNIQEAVEVSQAYDGPRTSMKETMVSIQKVFSKDVLNTSDVRDVQVTMDKEVLEQIICAAINKLSDRRIDKKKIMVSNQVHTDKTILNLYLAGGTFTAGELEFAHLENTVQVEGIDMNMILMKEMILETNCSWHIENKTDKSGFITGMGVRFIIDRAPKVAKSKNLVSVFKGKKKDLSREMMN